MFDFTNSDDTTILRVSASWMTKIFDCTLDHIVNHCHGVCCRHKKCWPSTAYSSGVCGYLGGNGCVLTVQERPYGCLLFPILLKNNTLVAFNRVLFPTSMCKGAYKKGNQILFDVQKAGLIEMFGVEQYQRVRHDIIKGKDSYFIAANSVLKQWHLEESWENNNMPPEPRNYIK